MKHAPLLLTVLLAACARPAPRPETPPEAPPVSTPEPTPPAPVAYRLELVRAPELAVRVEAELPGSEDGRTALIVIEGWGGVEDAGSRLEDLSVLGADGTTRPVERPAPHRFEVVHTPGERLTVHYQISASATPPSFQEHDYYDPVLLPGRLHVFGNQGFLRPEHLDGAERRPVCIRWSGFDEAGWTAISSFGVGTDPLDFVATMDEATHALYTAASDLRIETREVRGRPVHVAIHGTDWGFTDAELATLAETIVTIERGFFDDWDHPYFLIDVLPVGERQPNSTSMGGTALTRTFALFMQPGSGLAPPAIEGNRVPWLLAHEMFHDWNGIAIRMGGPEAEQYWFQEGFTNFYARRMLFRGGLIGAAEYVEDLNTQLAAYYLSPVHGEPNARIGEDFWNDPAVQGLPYERGDAVALLVDHAIRARTGGERSLDDWMRALLAAARDGAEPVTTEGLLADLEEWCGPEVAAHVRAVVVDGATLELEPEIFAPCLELVWGTSHAYDLGFDFETSRGAKTVSGVREGSAAWEAGVRDGQTLHGWSMAGRDATQPVRLQVEIDDEVRDVEYEPRGEGRAVPRFELCGDGLDAACEVL